MADKKEGAAPEAAYRKVDPANPESPVLPVNPEEIASAEPREPEEIEIEEGDTVAAHESHTLMSSPSKIAERLEQESGEDGLPTDVIARRQQEDSARLEAGRVSGTGRFAGAGQYQGGPVDADAVGRAVSDALRGATAEGRADTRTAKKAPADKEKASA